MFKRRVSYSVGYQMMLKPSVEQRKTLGIFLASRRARLQPEEVGLPGIQRRVPGLRREEVAILAGLSVSWYTWLEQGRDIRASAGTLTRVANVLRLDRVEAEHLFALSAREPPSFRGEEDVSDALAMLVRSMDPIPAYIRNNRFDVLVWNEAIANLFVDFGRLEPRERNTLRLLFTHLPYRTLILEWEQTARGMVSAFRAERAKATDKAPFDALVDELCDGSGEFREWWPEAEVKGYPESHNRLLHPTMGRVDLTCIPLMPEGRPNLVMTALIPRPAVSESMS